MVIGKAMNYIGYLMLALLTFSCINTDSGSTSDNVETEQQKTEKQQPSDEMQEDEKQAPAETKKAAIGKTYFTARGNEPGWYVEIKQGASGNYQYELKMNYGEDEFSGEAREIDAEKPGVLYMFKLMNDSLNLQLSIKDEACTDAAGQEYSHTVEILSDLKQHIGCGQFHN